MDNRSLSSKGLLFVFVLFVGYIANASASIISFDQNSLIVSPGDNFSLTIQGNGFPAIVGGGLNIDFDAAVLQIDQVTINQSVFSFYMGRGIEEGHIDNIAGRLSNTAFNTFFGASNSFDIMTIDFTALSSGSSLLSLSESSIWVFSDIYGTAVGDGISFSTATINVAAVPLPAAIWLLGSGLLVLLNVRRDFFMGKRA